MEGRVVPASTIIGAFGAGVGGAPVVTVLFDDGSRFSFFAFDQSFRGGVDVTLGHINGTSVPDVIAGVGPGGGPNVKVFDGAQLLADNAVATASFFAFDPRFAGGVSLAAGPVNGTGRDDVVVAAGSGLSSDVKVFDGASLAHNSVVATASFQAFSNGSNWVSVAVGAVNGTGHSDVIVGAGPGAPPEVKVYDGAKLAQGQVSTTADFMAFARSWSGGVSVAAGHINGAGHADVVVVPGPGGGPNVKVFDGAQLAAGNAVATASFYAFSPAFTGGVSVATGNIDGTGHDDVVVGAGPGGGPEVKVFDGQQLAAGRTSVTSDFFAFPLDYRDGVQVRVVPFPGHGRGILNVVPDPGGGPVVMSYDGAQLASGNTTPLYSFAAFDPTFRGGLNLGFVFATSFLNPYFRFATATPASRGSARPAGPVGGGFIGPIGLYGPFYGFYGPFGGFYGPFGGLYGSYGGLYGPYGYPLSTAGFSTIGGTTGGFGGYPGGGYAGGGYTGGGYTGAGYTGGGFSSGGFGGGGFSSGGFSGGGSSGGGSSLRAAGGRGLGVGGKAPGGGLYLAPGQLTLTTTGTYPEPGQGPGTTARAVTPGELQAAIAEAISWWDQAGLSPAQDRELRGVEVRVAGLGGDVLGRTIGDVITLSSTAAEYGWSVDSVGSGSPAPGRIDLPTVLAHEMGHTLGLGHSSRPGDVMDPTLPAGVRRMPTSHDV